MLDSDSSFGCHPLDRPPPEGLGTGPLGKTQIAPFGVFLVSKLPWEAP